jgi:hypothetical protein
MMKKMMLTVLAMMLLLTANALAKSTTYGKGVTVREVTPVSAILSDPGRYVGKMVRVSGMITEV